MECSEKIKNNELYKNHVRIIRNGGKKYGVIKKEIPMVSNMEVKHEKMKKKETLKILALTRRHTMQDIDKTKSNKEIEHQDLIIKKRERERERE